MDARVAGLLSAWTQTHVAYDFSKLPVHFLPFAQPREAQKLLAAKALQTGAVEAAGLLVDKVPERQQPHEIGALILVTLMGGCRRGLRVRRPLSRIGNAQRTRHHQHLGKTAQLLGGENHAPDRRIHRQAREAPPQIGQPVVGIDGAQLAQQPITVVDPPAIRRIQKREGIEIVDPQGAYLQQHGSQIGASNFRLSELPSRQVIFLAVQAYTHPGRGTTAAPHALIRRCPGNGFDGQALHVCAPAVAADPSEPRIDDVTHVRDRDGRLGDICCQHDAAFAVRLEQTLLLGQRQTRENWQHFAIVS